MEPFVVHETLKFVVPAILAIVFGVPVVRVMLKRYEGSSLPPSSLSAIEARLDRIESAIEAVAVEVERISEAQRFSVRLQASQPTPRLSDTPGAGSA